MKQLPNRHKYGIIKSTELLVNQVDDLECIILFGSCARGDVKSTSYIDLLVVGGKV